MQLKIWIPWLLSMQSCILSWFGKYYRAAAISVLYESVPKWLSIKTMNALKAFFLGSAKNQQENRNIGNMASLQLPSVDQNLSPSGARRSSPRRPSVTSAGIARVNLVKLESGTRNSDSEGEEEPKSVNQFSKPPRQAEPERRLSKPNLDSFNVSQ